MAIVIIKSGNDKRASHWNEIRSRVKTHEGEFLTGRKGLEYQRKWGRKYLGRDLNTRPVSSSDVERFEKTGH